ncbi:MAG: glycosyltransferase family 4 protein [Candidatus Ratteibacteria bacterium]|nr:glycosyltransferase family 4 protein [Candidatus Ratteibacteria bacterium]
MQKKIKVAHIITRLILGGAQENTLLTVDGLQKTDNYEVSLFTGPPLGPEGSLIEEAKKRGINLILVDASRRNIHPWLDFKSFFEFYYLLRNGGYHIVHTHSSKAGILGRLAAKCAGVPIIIHTIHGLPFFPYQNKFMNFAAVNLERITALITDKIITVCDNMAKKAHAAKVAPLDKFITIYSGMELDGFLNVKENKKLKESLGIKDNELVIGKIARLFELKGHRFLLKSAKETIDKFPNVKFLFVGNGNLREQLEKQASNLGIKDKIIFTGLVPREKIPDYISIMDIVVHVSLREGLARAIPQAFACGKPVVAFNIDGADEIIKDRQNGFLLPAPDVSEEKWEIYDCRQLTYYLLELLRDENLRKEMGEKGKKVVDPFFRAEYMVGQIDNLYRQLLRKKKVIP